MSKSKYPAKDGWINGKLTIEAGFKFTQDQMVNYCTGADPDLFEVVKFKHFKTVIRVTFRKIKLSDKQFNDIAHALGCDLLLTIPKEFTRNYFCASAKHPLSELIDLKLVTQSEPIPIYDNDCIYKVTERGKKVFLDSLDSWLKLKKKIK